MKYLRSGISLKSLCLAILCLNSASFGQTYFTASGFGDLLIGFRKTGIFIEQSELVVNAGNVTNFLKLSVGTTVSISNYSVLQITNMCPDDLANLQWSASSAFQPVGAPEQPWATPIGSFPKATCWYTVPRPDPAVQTAALPRPSYNSLGVLRGKILGIGVGGFRVSQSLATTNSFNNTKLVTEPVAFAGSGILTDLIGDVNDPTLGDFGGQIITYSVENTTPDPFTSATVCDFYQFCPTGFVDPLTHLTNGNATYVGYFTLATDGTMTFTRDTTNSTPPPPPPPPELVIGLSGNQTTISFATTNGATYTLYYTSSSGLNSPVSSWTALPSTITGDGSVKSFTDASTDADRFYRVKAQ